MTTVRTFIDRLGDWVPAFCVLIAWLLLIPPRLMVLLLLPRNSKMYGHPLRQVYKFVVFEW